MKYFLDQDEDCHWYLIPADKRAEWEAFRDDPEYLPEWAEPLGGGPNRVEFYLDN